jgi:hypothetical protein
MKESLLGYLATVASWKTRLVVRKQVVFLSRPAPVNKTMLCSAAKEKQVFTELPVCWT